LLDKILQLNYQMGQVLSLNYWLTLIEDRSSFIIYEVVEH
jgi:hypothetical protein